MEYEKYPAWLADKVLDYAFEWQTATRTSMQELLGAITLHDSSWCNTFIEDGNAWVLVVKLDAFWNKAFCHNLQEWPYLIIRLGHVYCSFQNFSEYDNDCRIIGSAETESVNGRRLNEWLSFGQISGLLAPDATKQASKIASLCRTEISTAYGGSLLLIHAPAIEVLLYSEQGSQLSINLSALR
jgi:hypothetical protein